jgi:hypothetical protein
MKEDIVILPVMFYLFVSVIATMFGILDAKFNTDCKKPLIRIEYVFPSYQLGCWLGQVPEENK